MNARANGCGVASPHYEEGSRWMCCGGNAGRTRKGSVNCLVVAPRSHSICVRPATVRDGRGVITCPFGTASRLHRVFGGASPLDSRLFRGSNQTQSFCHARATWLAWH